MSFKSRLRSCITYANVTATLALVVALGGTSYAALTIGGENVRDGSLTGADLKDGSVGPAKLASSQPKAAAAKKKKAKPGPPGPQGPAGPAGAQGAQGSAGTAPACQGNGSGDTMVAAGSVCIDKYENTIWTAPSGGTRITGTVPCNANGQDCTNIYARSIPAAGGSGVTPRANITWFQAQAALANVGKRLPTNAEWQQAGAGTPDPGIADNGTTDCNVHTGFAGEPGSRSSCVSRFGAYDMVGNLVEWVADWDELPGTCVVLEAGRGSDLSCIGRDIPNGDAAALVRGGYFGDVNNNAGSFALDGISPTVSVPRIGFRGAR